MGNKNKKRNKVSCTANCENCLFCDVVNIRLMCEQREHEVIKNECCDLWQSQWEI